MNQFIEDLLLEKAAQFNQFDFIVDDPISIPHQYSKKQDIEITAFWTAILSWGQRKTIINKCTELFEAMDNSPHDFVINHSDNDLKKFLSFKHRTFNATDTLYFISFFKWYYSKYDSLEKAFSVDEKDENVELGLTRFYNLFFSLEDAPSRTSKHIASPSKKSACKRINMFLRWMVRKDDKGVDFGLWADEIKMSQLVCPLDVHVDRVSRKLGLLKRKQSDWQGAVELTRSLSLIKPEDPTYFDYALFGLGLEKY